MVYLVAALFIFGVALLAVGYRKNHRNLLLAGAIVLFVSAMIQPFGKGFIDGIHGGWSSQSSVSSR